MNQIEGNYVDIIHQKIYPARIYFDTHIREINAIPHASTFILPGLVDAHVHVESSMLPPSEFARLALQHGTLAAVSDPHEIANVLGMEGINFMLQDAENLPFYFVFGAPSCVPATAFENTGINISVKEIEILFRDKNLGYLSEMMNYPGIIHDDPDVWAKIEVAKKYNKPVDGHAPKLSGADLRKYVAAGISTDHECANLDEAEEKIKLGMKILIRNGSAARNFESLFPLIDRYPDQVMLCTDDFHPDDLIQGHINKILEMAVSKGVDFFSALRAATVNPIRHYGIASGLLQPGDPADFIVVDDVQSFNVRQSFYQGKSVYSRGGEEPRKIMTDNLPSGRFNAGKITESDLVVNASSDRMKVIRVIDREIITEQMSIPVSKGNVVHLDIENDILKIVLLNRYQPGKPAVAFIHGFELKKGALASTIAHDSHHIIAVGCDDRSIVKSINQLIELKGGLIAAYDNYSVDLKLDIAGLMSSLSGEEVARKYQKLNETAADMGCALTAPFMTLSFMALLVMPDLKIGEKGLFDVNKFEWTSLWE